MRTENSRFPDADSQLPYRTHLQATCLTHLRNPVWHLSLPSTGRPGRRSGPHRRGGGAGGQQSAIMQSAPGQIGKGSAMSACLDEHWAQTQAEGKEDELAPSRCGRWEVRGAGLQGEGRGELRNSSPGLLGRSPGKGLAHGWGRWNSLYFWFKPGEGGGGARTEKPGLNGRRVSSLCPFLSWAESREEVLCPVFWHPLAEPTDTVRQPQRAWQRRKKIWLWIWSASWIRWSHKSSRWYPRSFSWNHRPWQI